MRKIIILIFVSLLPVAAFAQDTTLTVTSDGKVGIGTSTPSANLAIEDTFATLRLNGLGSNIFEAVRFDVNAANAFGRLISTNSIAMFIDADDDTEVATFRIIKDASFFAANAIELFRVQENGNVGIGTTNPRQKLEVVGGKIRITDGEFMSSSGVVDVRMGAKTFISGQGSIGTLSNHAFGIFTNSISRVHVAADGNVGIGRRNPIHPLEMASGAHVTAAGEWMSVSSKEFKKNITELALDDAVQALQHLNPVSFQYKAEGSNDMHLGFIAEDVPDLVATPDRKSLSPMDIVAVLTKVVQQQQRKIAELESRLNAMQ